MCFPLSRALLVNPQKGCYAGNHESVVKRDSCNLYFAALSEKDTILKDKDFFSLEYDFSNNKTKNNDR